MNNSDVVQRRLHNQKLSYSEFEKPAEVVRWLGAVQAQEFDSAKWALALRMRSATNAAIEKAYNEGKIVRTHVMRPTWHFVAHDDVRWLLQLTAPRVNIKAGPNYRKYELDAATFKRSNKALTKALRGGKYLTRRELKTVLNESRVAADDPIRLAHILLRAELDGVICSGPMHGKQFTYALLEERVPATKALDRDEALAKLTRRYFASHGPATLHDFTWWSGLTAKDAKNGIAANDRHLKEALIEGKIYHTSRSENAAEQSKQSAHLLPAYDEYTVAYKDRSAVLNPNEDKPLQGLLGPTVIVDGRIAGTWKRTTESIALQLSREISKSERVAISEAVDRYLSFQTLT